MLVYLLWYPYAVYDCKINVSTVECELYSITPLEIVFQNENHWNLHRNDLDEIWPHNISFY